MTLIELFTAIANAIREKTGKTESIVAENFPSEIEAIKTGAENVVEFTAPKGRMKGDVDGDGAITQTDYDLALAHTKGTLITDTIALWCADINGDGSVKMADYLQINAYLNNSGSTLTKTPLMADYYANWTYVKETDTSGYFYYDVPVSGMTANSSALLLASAYSDCFIGVECMNGSARIKAERLPLVETDCLLVWADGKEWDSINNGLLTKYAELPMGRMKGDIDGDGFITQTDVQIAKEHAQNVTYITDEIALWCADINNDAKINVFDYGQINSHISGAINFFNLQPTAGANPDYYGNWAWFKVDDLSGYFYRDIPINGMTANAKAKLLVSDYKDCFTGVECGEGFARVKADRLPLKAVKSFILWESAGFDLEEAGGVSVDTCTLTIQSNLGYASLAVAASALNADGKIEAVYTEGSNYVDNYTVNNAVCGSLCNVLDMSMSGSATVVGAEEIKNFSGTMVFKITASANGTASITIA